MAKAKKKVCCPCGNLLKYEDCCGAYILGLKVPQTAEALMRSRYTAYSQANIPYIQATMQEPAACGFDPVASEQWAKTVKWKRLKVWSSFPHESDPTIHYVKFTAFFELKGKLNQINEVSEFKQNEGVWYYVNRMANR